MAGRAGGGGGSGRPDSPEREHLGWRATSAVPAKKARLIENVSGRGLVELQAQLYAAQEGARLQAAGLADPTRDKHLRRKAGIDVSSIRNKGVEGREARDKALALRTTGHGDERLAAASAALEAKAALYERLAATGGAEGDDERYEVEFWRKGASHEQEAAAQERAWLEQRGGGGGALPQQAEVDTFEAAVAGSGAMMTEDMARELERRDWEAREAALLRQQEEEDARRAARRAAVHELSGQTQAGREEAAAAKAAKEQELAAKRAAMKAAFIQAQVQAALAAKKAKQQGSGSSKGKKSKGSSSRSKDKAGDAGAAPAPAPAPAPAAAPPAGAAGDGAGSEG